jgi:GNAT superfamily N-acetyltransferase
MPDLLVKLYDLPPAPAETPALTGMVRRAFAAERRLICDWVSAEFGNGWASECEASFARSPVTCFLAHDGYGVVGFACYDATARGMFGPMGVRLRDRKRGFGRELLLACLRDMSVRGYAYAVIGGAASMAFYEQAAGATEIPGSSPGFYRGMLKLR